MADGLANVQSRDAEIHSDPSSYRNCTGTGLKLNYVVPVNIHTPTTEEISRENLRLPGISTFSTQK